MASRQDLLGTWTLVSFEINYEDGTTDLPYGPRPFGMIYYAPDGLMLAHLTSPAPSEAPRIKFPPHIFYAARYRVEGDRIVHDLTVSALHPPAGAQLVRRFELHGDRLTLAFPPAASLGLKPGLSRLVWQRTATPQTGA